MRKWRKLCKSIVHFKRKLGLDRQENEKLNRIEKEFKERTAGVPDDIWELGDFVMLLDLAEYGYPLGRSKAIIYAFGVGYLAGKWGDE